MKLTLDEGLPLRAAGYLREAGVSTQHVLELGMAGASDKAVLERAAQDQSVLVTLDSDFHRILAETGAKGPSVIRIRMEGLSGRQVADLLAPIIEQLGKQLESGVAASVSGKRVRLRKLPLGRVIPGSASERSPAGQVLTQVA